ncbi:MAG: T9SS type A sorting domain-containing protein [Bacteroidales bacterium]|nr:T9SS type A sorting domain-containing protein [Bacteroidales bacterium]
MKKINRIFFQILALALMMSSAIGNAFAQGGFCINAYMLQEESCSPGEDGMATVFIPSALSGHCTIEWQLGNGQTSSLETVSGLKKGTYHVSVKSNTCPNVVFFTGMVKVTKSSDCDLDVNISGPGSVTGDCNGMPSITFTATVSGGTPPYHFNGWHQVGNSSATMTMTPVEGQFTVNCSVQDANGVTGSDELVGFAKKMECAQDPNEIKGPAGYSEEHHFVNNSDKMNYTIEFENDPDFAMAPASRVKITYDVPDKQKLASFRLADFGFGDFVFTVPSNVSSYSQRLDVSDSLGVWVDVNAGIDVAHNQLFWIFQSIDPATGAEPASSQMGFLPINDSLEHGQGYVSFYIAPNANVQTGDTVAAEALIVFDDNAPIGTNVWTNTFDAVAPSSTLHAEMNTTDSLYCTFSFDVQDDANGSGARSVEVYMSANNADYISIGSTEPDSTLSFVLESGVYYQFMSIATDNVGNKEPFKAQPDTAINYNTAPIDLVLNGSSFYEYDPINSMIGTLYTLDNDVNLPFVYELVAGVGDDDNNLFTIEGNVLKTNATFVCSHQTEYSVRIRTTDIGGLSFEKSFDLNEIMQHVTPITRLNVTLCEGSSLDFYGVELTEEGTYTDTLTTAAGCDSIIVWYVTMSPVYAQTESAIICASELPYTWRDTIFEPGTVSDEYVFYRSTAKGCDSVVTLNLTVNPVYEVDDQKAICASELPYTWNGVQFTEAGTQTATLQTVNGCDSLVTMTLTVNPIYTETDSRTICPSELPYTWNGVEFTQAGTQTVTLPTVNNCDSVVTMTLTTFPTYEVSDAQTICPSELPYTWNGVVFTQAGTQTVTLPTVNNCDSVVTMTLTTFPTYEVSDVQTICPSELPYTWNGVQFTEAGTQTATLETVNGCDSVVTMTLTTFPTYEVSDAQTICPSELPYTWNGVTFAEAGTQTTTLETVNGCDSVVTMTLTTFPTYDVTDTKAICESALPYIWNGVQFTEAGTQTATLETVNGCDSVVTMTLTVNPIYSETDSRTICASELPYTWNGVTFTQADIQTATLETVNGCDSVVTMTLNVNPIYSVDDSRTICASELPYTWNSVQFTEAGTQTATLETVNGCDSVVTMTLNVNPIYSVTDSKTICVSQLPYTWNNVVFTEAGTQTTTLQTVNDCDSVVTMTLTVTNAFDVADSKTICASELPYTWNGVVFTQAGTQIATLETVNGCDSVVTMTLTTFPTYEVSDAQTICPSELPYTWNGVVFTQVGTQAVTLPTVDGCDSVVTMTLTTFPTYEVSDAQTICPSELPYTWNDVVFTQAGTQTVTLPTVNNCDSVVTMTLATFPTYEVSDAQTICPSELPYTWNGVVFTQAGTQTVTLPTVNNCDSVVTMTLTTFPTYEVSDAQTICPGELPYTWNGVVFTQAGTQTVTLPTVNNCDSVVTMTLTTFPTYEVSDAQTICPGELPYTWNGVVFTQAGTQTVTLPTVNNCDSVVTMALTTFPTYEVSDAQTICASELPYTWNGVVFAQAGTQTVTLPTVDGCDSVVTMTLIVNPIYSETETRTICASELPYIWNGVTFIEAGTQTATLPTINGCDSVVTMTLIVNPIYSESESRTICASELPYTWNGVEFTQAGTQTTTLPTIAGCDSVVTMTLIVNPVYAESESRTICASELPHIWNGVEFTQAGTQTATLPTVEGCDSVVTMTLIVNPIYSETETRTICASELPYTWNGVEFTQAGTQTATLPTVAGCDSVVTMTLIVNPVYAESESRTICASELPYTWNGVEFTQAGTQTAILPTVAGCDSVVTMTLIVNPVYAESESRIICASELPYTWNGVEFTQAGTQTVTLPTVDGCDSVIAMTLIVNPIYSESESRTICAGELPYTWNGVEFTQAGTQTVTLSTVNGCDSVVTMTLTVNQPTTGIDEQEACDAFAWIDGTVYTESTNTPTFTLTNAAGCDSVVTLHLTIHESVTIDAYLTIQESDLPYTYGDTTFEPGTVQSGDYSFYFTTEYGCDSIIVLHLTVETGIDNYAMTASMYVYPNPTSDKVNVQLTVNDESLNDGEIHLYDMYGKWLRTVKVTGKVTEIDLSSFAAGVYFVKAVEGQQLIGVRKIVKE